MKKRYLITGSVILLAIAIAGSGGVYTYWHTAAPERTCASCHEIESAHDIWAESPHRDIACAGCHGTALSSGLHSLIEKGQEFLAHFGRQPDDVVRLTEGQVIEAMQRCRECHAREYADWLSGGHSPTYADIFLNQTHNREEQLSESCLRCHGMFFEGTISDVVSPVDVSGPWQMVDTRLASVPTIPCMACHHIHAEGQPAFRPDYSDPAAIAANRLSRTARVGFYDRYERMHFAPAELPAPQVSHNGVPIQAAIDPIQRLCVQCHAPNAFRQAGSSDDRTPRGVHEGLSCGACHAAHSNDAKDSCVDCHPQLSNCGLDVRTMETTYNDPSSPNNIHFVACSDCHDREFLQNRPQTN
ncbi:MAG: hypothetical protein JSW51_08740 [Gemmatimonadota bacterium]|nr:MAG: hypothetical protein JSW51_08740 [Gemmatimonadota bacterium]